MGFRRDYSCGDLIHVLRQVGEKCIEWGECVWMASLDLEKAFDKIIHIAMLEGLREAGVDECTYQAIQRIYADQCGYVQLEPELRSRFFSILCGVRQGDPLSPILFTNTARAGMQVLKEKWEAKRYGTLVGANADIHRLTYVMFADDTTLIAKSRKALKQMLKDVITEMSKLGLNLNVDKCKVQCSQSVIRPRKVLEVNGVSLQVVDREEGFKVLGTTFTLDGSTKAEFESRLNAAWAKFHEMKPLLCKKDANMNKRLRLFEASVSKTALWCADSWTLSVKQKRHLRAVQRAMLRRMVGPGRMPDEEYIPWIIRSTHIAEDRARDAKVNCWLKQHLRLKWQWAGKIANMNEERWAYRLTAWRDSAWQSEHGAETGRPLRSRPGNRLRWEDDLRKYATSNGFGTWRTAALSNATWHDHEDKFIECAWR